MYKGIRLIEEAGQEVANYGYFPIIEKECSLDRDALYQKLKYKGVFAAATSYPLISEFDVSSNGIGLNVTIYQWLTQQPKKLFAYLSIRLSDESLKRITSILNES